MSKINRKELHEFFLELKNNNKRSFDELYNKYSKLVYGIVFPIIKNKEDSEDVVQKVFLKIWKMDKQKLPNNNEASWLYTVSKNEALNYIRTENKTISLDEIYYLNDEDKNINKYIDKDAYNRIISKLEKEEQEIVSLKILGNMSFKEISQILNKPIGTIQWKYYKSLYSLKLFLSNLSMFIITVILGLTTLKDKEKNQELEVQEGNTNEDKNQNEVITLPAKPDSSLDEFREDNKVEIQNNEITENIQIDTNKEINTNNVNINMGILSLSGIFLFITIFFAIIVSKQNNNSRRKRK